LNSGLNHPFELIPLLIPSATIGLVFGVGEVALGASLLVATQASIVHSNLNLNNVGIGWIFTTNRYHIHHHSVVLEESNTNYGCAAIVWDRLFGTFVDASTIETGTGPTEPGMWRKFLMPFSEPSDTATAPPS
jgi:sterol desaturase/sphingolipid hydroxylase (fatty acid hydroxylase superfamily)